MCVLNDKPLFESGTQGQKATGQVIIPYKTATYSEIRDPQDDSIPMCTIEIFPSNIQHCVEWALDIFNKIFNESLNDLKKLGDKIALLEELENLNMITCLKERIDNMSALHKCLSDIEYRKANKKILILQVL